MPTAILADDEPLMRDALREQLAALWPELQIIGDAEDGPAALRTIESLSPDIAFLDVRMPGMSGLDVARALTVTTRVVFVTAYDAHAVEAFETRAIDYVLKPLEPARLARSVARLRQATAIDQERGARAFAGAGLPPQMSSGSIRQADAADRCRMPNPTRGIVGPEAGQAMQWLQVAVGQQVRMLHLEDVIYFESDTKYTRVVGPDCDGLVRVPLKDLIEACESTLPGAFLQTHRSVVVNRRFIRSVHRRGESLEIEVRGRDERLKVSTSNHHLFRAM